MTSDRLQVTRVLLAGILIQACTPNNAMPPAQTIAPIAAGPAVLLPGGAIISVELAAEEETRAQGLMYRESVAAGKGMLFLFPETGPHSFWMKNTLIPLDIIWMDESRRIVHIARDVPPCRADPCPSYVSPAVSRFVLELAAGQARGHGLKVGDQLTFREVDETVVR